MRGVVLDQEFLTPKWDAFVEVGGGIEVVVESGVDTVVQQNEERRKVMRDGAIRTLSYLTLRRCVNLERT